MNLEKLITQKGFIDLKPRGDIDLVGEIIRLKKEKNAVILAHFYQDGIIQDIADFVGDSLGLAQQAAATTADIIVFAGVHFMAETAKILSPHKKVLIPDLNAGCSLADSCTYDNFKAFKEQHPDHLVVSYVNTTAQIKSLTDIVCTSSNAVSIIKSLPPEQKIIFGPDRNLGNYISSLLDRPMVVWDGACMVHEEFSLEKIIDIKNKYPGSKLLSHPECQKPILLVSDYIGSTSQMLEFSKKDDAQTYIVATESGIIHQMKKASPAKTFIPAPPNDSTCACNDCKYMRLITIEKLYNTLLYELPEVTLPVDLMDKARRSIVNMLELSERFGIK
jgi:quinolinate synthase